MTPDRDDTMTGAETAAREAVRALGTPVADPAFRKRLRREFLAGTLAAPARPAVVRGPWERARRTLLFPAAAVLIAVAAVSLLSPPRWEVLSVVGDGLIVVDQRIIPSRHADDLARALRSGARVRADGATIDLGIRGHLVVQVTNGTDMTLPPAPRRWLARESRGALRTGEVRITTGPRFAGARLMLETPEALVQVTGTTLAVIREPAGTCVCVHDGTVTVGPKGGAMQTITEGRRGFVFTDLRTEEAEIRSAEIGALSAFRDRHRPRLARESK